MTSAELRRADVGNWFNRSHPRLARDEYARQSVPTLEQVFAILKSSGRNSVAYLELKIDKGDAYADLVSSVAELITQHELERRIVVVSFNLKALALVKELNSSIRIGALFEPKGGLTTIVRKQRMIRAAVDCAADEILLHRRLAGHGIFELAKANKLQPVVWTVDDPKWISRAMALGIHALITNDPSGILEAQVY